MTDEKYLETQQQVVTLAGLIADMDLGGFLARIARAETMGVFLMAPQDYQRAAPTMHRIERLARALLSVQHEARMVRDEVTKG